jgi:hypothetical protein
MFTFGIFTSHIPYIAVVAFYAYFLIFGVNKAVNGEIQVSDNQFITEVQSTSIDADFNTDSNFHYQNDFDFYVHSHFEESVFKRKIKYRNSFFAETLQTGFNKSCYSRPPPSIV